MKYGPISSWFSRGNELSVLGAVDSPRWVQLVAEVRATEPARSPFSGAPCAYYQGQIGRADALQGEDGVVRVFEPLGTATSPHDLVVKTADAFEVVLPAGYFIVVAGRLPRTERSLERVPDELAYLGIDPAKLTGAIWYREVVLRPGSLVRFSGIVETVLASANYRSNAQRSLRMRPMREPLVVQELV
ncbi:MAG: hypothetical protein U0414_00380 [Polyangiaceae bacterium]